MTDAGQNPTDSLLFDAFGVQEYKSGSTPTPYGFAAGSGYQLDKDSNLILCGYRYYNPATGRFMSSDPAGAGDNWYAYCNNDPLNFVDPLGLQKHKVNPDGTVGAGSDWHLDHGVEEDENGTPLDGTYYDDVEDQYYTFNNGIRDDTNTGGNVTNPDPLSNDGDPTYLRAAFGAGADSAADGLVFVPSMMVLPEGGAATAGAEVAVEQAQKLYLIDENLPAQLAALLERAGVNAVSVQRALGTGVKDAETIIPWLKENNATIITKNIKDFVNQGVEHIHVSTGNEGGKAADILEHLRPIIGF